MVGYCGGCRERAQRQRESQCQSLHESSVEFECPAGMEGGATCHIHEAPKRPFHESRTLRDVPPWFTRYAEDRLPEISRSM